MKIPPNHIAQVHRAWALTVLSILASCGLTFAQENEAQVQPPAALYEFDMQVSTQRAIQGICRIAGDQLELAMPLPGAARPQDFDALTANTHRLTLQRDSTAAIKGSPLLGAWKVTHSLKGNEPSERFLGDIVVFEEELMRITEAGGAATPYQVPYEVRTAPRLLASQRDNVQYLRETYGAEVRLNRRGEATELMVTAIQETQPPRQLTPELCQRIASLTTLETLVLTDFAHKLNAHSLAFLKPLTGLRKLDIRKTGLTDDALSQLVHLPSLRVLKLEFNDQLTDQGLAHLAGLTELVELDLAFVPIQDAGLASLRNLTQLQRLYLYGTQVTDRGLPVLRELPHLEVLYLGSETGQAVSDASTPVLTKLASLKMLGLYGTQLTATGIAQIKQALPECDVLAPKSPAVKHTSTERAFEPLPEGSGSGTLVLGDQTYSLSHGVAYQLSLKQQLVTTVLLTSEPVSLAPLGDELKRHQTDYGFAPFLNQIRLRFDASGSLLEVHLYADDFTVNAPGSQLSFQGKLTPNHAKGAVTMQQAGTFDGKAFEIKATFDLPVHPAHTL